MFVNTPPLQDPCQTSQHSFSWHPFKRPDSKVYYCTVFIFKYKSGNDKSTFTTAPLSSCLPAPTSHSMCCSAACGGRGAQQSSASTALCLLLQYSQQLHGQTCSQKDFSTACIMRTILRLGLFQEDSPLLCIFRHFGNCMTGSETSFSDLAL